MPSRQQPRERYYRRTDTRSPDIKTQLSISNRFFTTIVEPMADDPEHPMVKLRITPALRQMDLSAMTTEEVEALRGWFNDLCDRAVVVTKSLDQLAEEARVNGDTSYKRLWRPSPVRLDFDQPQPQPQPERTKEPDPCLPETPSTTSSATP
jgi:hypothetical protein